MNISIDLHKTQLSNIYFLDKKRNIIMDGNFTKIIYSNDCFTMNGLYILFPIEVLQIEKNANNNILKFNPYQNNNMSLIQDFAKLEYRIIEYYKNTYHSRCKISNFLSKQMHSGNMKLYKEFNSTDIEKRNTQYIIKISGVWETYEDVGLTYKLIEVNENYLE
jgi:hypothetical protein